MKVKRNKAAPKSKPVNQKKAAAAIPQEAPVASPVRVVQLDYPPPEWLAEEAAKEINRGLVEDYTEAITTLRNDKRFTFREIAQWLQDRGIEADHNAVYRAYTKGMTVEEAHFFEETEED